MVEFSVFALSYAACASGTLEAQSEPPVRNGKPRRRASCAAPYETSDGSGVPKVGAPDCIEIDEAKVPNNTGAPGRMSWVKEAPAKTSARTWVSVAATGTGLMAPARMNGVTMQAWLLCA